MSEREELAEVIWLFRPMERTPDGGPKPFADLKPYLQERYLRWADAVLAAGFGKLAPLQREIEELQEFQNSIADRMPEEYDGDEAQEYHINRWLDHLTRGES